MLRLKRALRKEQHFRVEWEGEAPPATRPRGGQGNAPPVGPGVFERCGMRVPTVPAPAPWRPDALHLFHLLRDDLPLLHTLLSEGRVESVGAWKTLHEAGVATDVRSEDAATKLQTRCAIWQAVVQSHRNHSSG